jgi:hypothetical protein
MGLDGGGGWFWYRRGIAEDVDSFCGFGLLSFAIKILDRDHDQREWTVSLLSLVQSGSDSLRFHPLYFPVRGVVDVDTLIVVGSSSRSRNSDIGDIADSDRGQRRYDGFG